MEYYGLRLRTIAAVLVLASLCLIIYELLLKPRYSIADLLLDSNQLISRSDVDKQLLIFKDQSKLRRYTNNRPTNLSQLQYSYVPQVSCPTMVRLGGVEDGGKWVCNPWLAPNPCVIFSLGVNADSEFEINLQQWVPSLCTVYGFDSNVTFKSTYNKVPNGRFFDYQISGVTNESNKTYTIQALSKKLNVVRIDFLKIDIESSEFSVVPTLFQADGITLIVPICQLMVEVHPFFAVHFREWIKLLSTLEKGRFLLFQREVNPYCLPPCFEYAWIHKDCLPDYHVRLPALFSNF